MTRDFDRAMRAWGACYDNLGTDEVHRRVRTFGAIVRGIAARGRFSPSELPPEAGSDPQRSRESIADLQAAGFEFDADGSIVGAALTTRLTPHRLHFRHGRPLYAWCALDTLFLPGLIGEAAAVESSCPVSGGAVHVSVSPDGVESCEPTDAVVSVFLPGDAVQARTGPASPT